MTRWPAEWAPHERTVMCWPARTELWNGRVAEAERAHADVAVAIGRFEPVTIIAPPGSGERVESTCSAAGANDHAHVEVIELPIDDSWFRDSGPVYVVDDAGADGADRRVALDWTFNAWGEKFLPFDADAAIARRWTEHVGHRRRRVDMVFEGGAVNGNGAGTLITTSQCLLHPNRNPGLGQDEIEQRLRTEFGADDVIWLPFGLALDDDTDGHVDNVAAFSPSGTLLLQGCADTDGDDVRRLAANRNAVASHQEATGADIDVVEIPVLPFTEVDGERLAVPYLNFYVGNGFVVVPTCGHPADDEMVSLIGEQFPGRATFALDVGAILAFGGGGIHCITQQVPTR